MGKRGDGRVFRICRTCETTSAGGSHAIARLASLRGDRWYLAVSLRPRLTGQPEAAGSAMQGKAATAVVAFVLMLRWYRVSPPGGRHAARGGLRHTAARSPDSCVAPASCVSIAVISEFFA